MAFHTHVKQIYCRGWVFSIKLQAAV